MALVGGGDEVREGNLLAAVGGVGVEFLIVDADLVVGVAGGDGDLDVDGEDIRGGDVEGVDGGVLEDEAWVLGLEDCPHQEYDEEDDEEEDKQSGEASPQLMMLVPMVAAVF